MTNASTPKVSILIPCYNAAHYVRAALESALAQTWPNLEIIVVDDGSTDGSVAVCEGYADRGVQVITQSNMGAASARNRALSASTGQFALFLDADDVIDAEHISQLAVAIVGAPRCVAMSQWDRFRTTLAEAEFPHRAGYRDASGVDWLVQAWADGQPMTQPGMFLIPRELLDEAGGWDTRLSLIDDFEFMARLLSISAGVRFAPSARLYYRSAVKDSLSARKSRAAVESACLSMLLATQHLLDAENSPRTRRACANILCSFDYTYYPEHADLRAQVRARVSELGGADLEPIGPPGFHMLRHAIGWRAARRVQKLAERLGLNAAARQHRKLHQLQAGRCKP